MKPYWAYKQPETAPTFEDPTIALDHIELTEDEVASFLTAEQLSTLHIMNSNTGGYVEVTFYEDESGKVYYTQPDDVATTPATYTVLNMFGVHTVTQKGNLSVEDVEGVSDNNAWITGGTGLYYGLKKNMVEILPFNTTNIIDVNPGLANQQHPCY